MKNDTIIALAKALGRIVEAGIGFVLVFDGIWECSKMVAIAEANLEED